ncbi:prenyltransferase/squalene oxidase repeat-containing protein [Alienimonas californiensis]|uniref:Squalene--hopene cyclase n=1 Tax=Alienimonas californiensis TaxID=2527989 RepID=A0A517PA49_9PLAN|nr:prenyltransferase/squalene oxidase repeat-containing protein [Alienimonas californiensis]QDT16242.1 Squalene--hopene cyclase [Alienimonas californiensis]
MSGGTDPVDPDRLAAATESAVAHLLSERTPAGHWVGELSTSALSTAVAAMALHQYQASGGRQPSVSSDALEHTEGSRPPLARLIDSACIWLLAHRNADGGWGDTVESKTNVSTTALCIATVSVWDAPTENRAKRDEVVADARRWFDAAGGFDAVVRRYGKDKTFSVPILTHCALAGLVPWSKVTALPFELATLPPRFYAAVRLPVVSYALPALIAIGQLRHVKQPSRNPALRGLRALAVPRTLDRLQSIQPSNGGFLEAAPLTGFVLMSLSAAGRADHPVARKCVEFLTGNVREDGSWPIDTNLATWVTTLAVGALGDDLPEAARPPIRDWLLGQQYREVHPYTRAAPGGWAWTDLPGGVPDADDTPGAILALNELRDESRDRQGAQDAFKPADAATLPDGRASREAIDAGVLWLLGLQNRDGGVPTFCRGWGALPFDRSAPDLTAHAVRALSAIDQPFAGRADRSPLDERVADESDGWRPGRAMTRMVHAYLRTTQRPDGSWLPLWFGNQHAPDDENPVYGTARVLAAFADCGLTDDPACVAGREFLLSVQNADGGWGGARDCPSSVEETALASEILLRLVPDRPEPWAGVRWLLERVEDGRWTVPSPIGFYFAKLWYHERLYPVIFTVQALRTARSAGTVRGGAAALRERGDGRHDGVSASAAV